MNILESIGLSKQFGTRKAIQDLNFQLAEGEILGLIGPNGAGKTTLINLITGAITFSTGDILFRGQTIHGLKPYQIAQLGITKTYDIVPPSTQMSTLENVMVGALFGSKEKGRSLREARKKAEETLACLDLSNQKDMPVFKLNGFEKKRLEIAKSLSMNPKLLLLDEIMSGLNQTEIIAATRLIQKIRGTGISLLVVEHQMKTIVQLSDRVIVLHQGKKIMEGPVDQVLKNEEVIKAYLGNRYGDLMGTD